MFRFLTTTAAALLAASIGSAQAQGVKAGQLDCNVAAGVGLVIGSQRNVSCTFTPAAPGPIEHYTGTISKLGLDIGVTGGGTMVWLVVAAAPWQRGALQGSYVGGSAEASVIAGVGANALVGGLNRSFALQPLSVQGQVGLNIAAGIAGLELAYVPY
jgi:hypothetical protein